MTEEKNAEHERLDDDELEAQNAEELPDREVMSVISPMNPGAPVGGEVIQPGPPDT